MERRSIPGIEEIGSRTPSPAVMKSGWTRWSAVRSVSRTRSRSGSVRRRRRSRVAGKLMDLILGPTLSKPSQGQSRQQEIAQGQQREVEQRHAQIGARGRKGTRERVD